MGDSLADADQAAEMFSGIVIRAAFYDAVLSTEHIELLYKAWVLEQERFRLSPQAAALILAALMLVMVLLLR